MDELLLEEWDICSNFEGYYQVCAPASCTYTVIEQLDIVYTFATILGLLNGLSIVFRLLVPCSVQLAHLAIVYWRSRNSNIKGKKV